MKSILIAIIIIILILVGAWYLIRPDNNPVAPSYAPAAPKANQPAPNPSGY